MKPVYERTILFITEFDTEDVITTSGEEEPVEEPTVLTKNENRYFSFGVIDQAPKSWF